MNRKIGYQEKESFAIEVEKDVIDGVREGRITHIGLDLSEKNQSKILGLLVILGGEIFGNTDKYLLLQHLLHI